MSSDVLYSIDYSIYYYVYAFWKPTMIFVGIWFIIAYFSHQRIINSSSGAEYIKRSDLPELYNMLENLCISRGIKMPKLAIIDAPEMNAYASGINDRTYTITLTTGLLENLEKDEIEAVLAHELSHIMNRDVRLLIITVIFVGIFSLISEMIFRKLMYGSSRRSPASVMIALFVALIGYLLAILLRFAISRKREYLADFGAVQLTKNPNALISALRKISKKSDLKAPPEIMQMCIENKPKFDFLSIFSTHPPIQKRIKSLELYAGGGEYKIA